MAADAAYVILGIGDEQVRIIRIGPVSRIGQPEVLPDHDTVTVASLIEFFIADHAHPVAQDVHVHIGMISDSCIVFTSAVVQVRLTESPVAAASDEAPSVDIHIQNTLVLIEGHLADTGLVRKAVRKFSVGLERESSIIEVRLTISVGPPQTRMFHIQLSEAFRSEKDLFLFAGFQSNLLGKTESTDTSFQHTLNFLVAVVLHESMSGKAHGSSVRQREYTLYQRITDGYVTGAYKLHIVPDTDISAADRRDPVPADRCMEGRIVRSQDSSVEVCALLVLFLDSSQVAVLHDLYRKNILSGNNQLRHIQFAADERAFDVACFPAVQIDMSLPVDSVKVQEHPVFDETFGNRKLVTVPEIGIEE